MMQNVGIVLTRDRIMDRVWGTDYEGESRTLDMHIKTLRKKLGENQSESVYEIVEDDVELSAVLKVFEELLEDVEIER